MTKPARGSDSIPGKLVDSFNRRINYLRISVTDRCNLRCRYCMPSEGVDLLPPDQVLHYEELLRIARLAIAGGITKIRITGGEPLVRKGLTEFISTLSHIEGLYDLSLTTNGLLLEDFAQSLYEAGLRRVNVSLDSLKPERYSAITRTRLGTLDRVLSGIRWAREVGLNPVKINMVVIRGVNDDEIIEFAELTRGEDLHVRFIEYMPMGRNESWSSDSYLPSEKVKSILETSGKLIPADGKGSGPAVIYKFPKGNGRIGFISPISHHFCNSCDRLRITADGKMRTCLFSDSEVDLIGPMRSGVSDKELFNILHYGTSIKPRGHNLDQGGGETLRHMYQIGG